MGHDQIKYRILGILNLNKALNQAAQQFFGFERIE